MQRRSHRERNSWEFGVGRIWRQNEQRKEEREGKRDNCGFLKEIEK